MNNVYALLTSLVLAVLLCVSHMLLKHASSSSAMAGIDFYRQNFVTIALALTVYIAVFLLYPYVLRYFSISVIFPVYTGLTIVLVMMSAAFFFGEKVELVQYLGAALVICGISLIATSGKV